MIGLISDEFALGILKGYLLGQIMALAGLVIAWNWHHIKNFWWNGRWRKSVRDFRREHPEWYR